MCWIKKYVDNHPEIVKFFENSLVPDECFFQTIFMASPYRSTRREKLTYLEWEKCGNHPRILTAEDVSMLLAKPELFARKFDTETDSETIKLLKEFI